MESQLQGLIDKIKTEGIAAAEKKAGSIISAAEEKAKGIISGANEEAAQIISKAKNAAAQTEDAGKKALDQAARNLLLSIQKNITDLLNGFLQKQIGTALTQETLGEMLKKIISNWGRAQGAEQGLEALVGKDDAEKLSRGILAGLQKECKRGITLKPSSTVDAGFRIGEQGGNMHYDFTDQGLAELVAQYVNPKLAELLKSK